MPLGFVLASGTPWISDIALICKGIISIITHNDVIQNCNIQQNSAISDLLGDFIVSFAWLKVATWMIVTEDDARGMVGKANLEYFLWINHGSGDPTFRDADFLDDSICLIQQQDPEFFVRKISDQGFEDLKSIIAARNFIL
jgi:hypothetical protein